MIAAFSNSKDSAILNEVPQGAYVVEVVPDSSADNAGVEVDDIITKITITSHCYFFQPSALRAV